MCFLSANAVCYVITSDLLFLNWAHEAREYKKEVMIIFLLLLLLLLLIEKYHTAVVVIVWQGGWFRIFVSKKYKNDIFWMKNVCCCVFHFNFRVVVSTSNKICGLWNYKTHEVFRNLILWEFSPAATVAVYWYFIICLTFMPAAQKRDCKNELYFRTTVDPTVLKMKWQKREREILTCL